MDLFDLRATLNDAVANFTALPHADSDYGWYRSPLYKRGVPHTFEELDEMQLFTGLGWCAPALLHPASSENAHFIFNGKHQCLTLL
jgi:hypothetical protein